MMFRLWMGENHTLHVRNEEKNIPQYLIESSPSYVDTEHVLGVSISQGEAEMSPPSNTNQPSLTQSTTKNNKRRKASFGRVGSIHLVQE